MPQHLDLTIRFLTDRYHGRGDDWPPSPARLYQALVSGAKTGATGRRWSDRHQSAFEWLERLGPPEIFARTASVGKAYTIYVPNNSLAGDKTSTKTSKEVFPRILARQVVGEPDVVYRWPVKDEETARAHLPVLDQVASQLLALGWGVDFAAAIARITDGPTPPSDLEHFTPGSRGGKLLRIPEAGFLVHLGDCHQAFTHRITKEGINPYTRPTRFGQSHYRRAGSPIPRRSIVFEVQTPGGEPFAARWEQTQTVAAWLRHAAGQALRQEEMSQEWIDSYVLGHTAPEELGQRLSFLPLPSIGYKHTDGGIRRVMIAEPWDASADAEALDLLRIKLAGWILTDEQGTDCAVLVPVHDERKVLPFYTRSAKVWQTVTPVILHGYNAARGRISLAKTDRLLCQAFDAAGFPESLIDNITFQAAPYWAGAGAANAIRVPRHLLNWPRLHVRVEFREPLAGPVLAGLGRHCGIGVFAAAQE